jgi:antitoxin component of MazEF toxin-antitoxin module
MSSSNSSLKLRRKLSKSGLTLVLRIPKDVERQLALSEDTEVEIWIENDKIVLKPIRGKKNE